MLRIPAKSLAGRHLFRIPPLDKSRVGPARSADKNFSVHTSTKSRRPRKQTRFSGVVADFKFAQRPQRTYFLNAGWSSLVARQAHNLKVAGSNPAPATKSLAARTRVRKFHAAQSSANDPE